MIKVIIFGNGNLGMHLIDAFLKAKEVELVQVYSRNTISIKTIETITNIKDLKDADIYIMAISDDAIAPFSSQLTLKNKLVVHTSGSVPMDSISAISNKGVFYPLQTFTKDKSINFKEIPICIEAEKNNDVTLLENLANTISNSVYFIDSNQRKRIHLAAVFVNNFVNHLYKIGIDICNTYQIPKEILAPLIQETARKIKSIHPKDAQTGPARRNDQKTIHSQLALLSGKNKAIYQLLTESIQQTYGKKL